MNIHRQFLLRSTALFLLAGAVPACAGTPATPGNGPTPSSDPSTAELEALYRARADSATMDVHEADVHFMTGMVGHHAQALVMSGLAPDNDASHQIRVLAARIINAQKDEIAVMQEWLRDRDRPAPEVDAMGHVTGPAGHDMRMAGMLSPEQLAQLRDATGPEFDRLFLTFMIQHHNGAVSMVTELFATDGAAQDDLTFKLASDIQVDQITEVARMESMLEAMQSPRRNR